jgi:hypothetical protein
MVHIYMLTKKCNENVTYGAGGKIKADPAFNWLQATFKLFFKLS